MKIKKVHCFFEQSGTFKAAFKHFGIAASDYDIQNEFGETDFKLDLFDEIEKCYVRQPSIFDFITKDDLIFAFFPCIHFCDYKTLYFKGISVSQKKWSLGKIMEWNIVEAEKRFYFFNILLKFCSIVDRLHLRMILENPWTPSRSSFLQTHFIEPTIIDYNRRLRGDYFKKSTAYWFFGFKPFFSMTYQKPSKLLTIDNMRSSKYRGLCSQQRSQISNEYAINFVSDFILNCSQKGKSQQLDLFN